MATLVETANYISSIYEAQSIFVDKTVLKERLGHTDTFRLRVQSELLNNYVKIMVNYFDDFITAGIDDHSYDTNNFFTTDEVEDVILRINLIADTNYTLNL